MSEPTTATGREADAKPPPDAVPALRVQGLDVNFSVRRGVIARSRLSAVRDVSFDIPTGQTLGLVGESGSGKSSTGRAILRLVPASRGSVEVDGQEITTLKGGELRQARSNMQMVFQDPYSSLDPSMTVAESIAEPLDVHLDLTRSQRRARVEELIELARLSSRYLDRYPYEFSGGQRQRIAIARAIALNPRLLVLDEAVSALDVSTQNQIINLLEDIQQEFELAYLFIAHDLAVVEHIAQQVAVMYLGEIVEVGPTQRLFEHPGHPYTEALLSAVPIPDPQRQRARERIVLPGDMPDPTSPPAGCSFHTRCPYVMDICRQVVPPPIPVAGGGTARCHLHTDGPALAGGTIRGLPLLDPAS